MLNRKLIHIFSYSLVLILIGQLPVFAQEMTSASSQQPLPRQALLSQFARANVVYLGETHDSVQDHRAQLEIIQALYQQQPRIAIGMEMFQRPFQGVVDRYLRGELTEVELLEQSQYAQRWGFPWQFYAPILRFAKEKQLPVLALNTPSEVTRKVARQGLASLTPAEQQWIPPLEQIDTSNAAYREKIRQVYDQFHRGHSASMNFERFWQAQVLWDETMAAAIADYVRANPDTLVIVLAGQGHIAYGHGIPSRVSRRVSGQLSQPFKQYSVLLNPEVELQKATPAAADFFWNHQP